MFHEMTIAEPIEKIADDWDFFEDKIVGKFTGFRTVGQNIYGIRRRMITRTEIVDPRKGNYSEALEMGPKGVQTIHFEPMRVHVTTGGTPHRVQHSFGFWHINDMDELYLPLPRMPGDEFGHFLVIMQTPTGNEGESWAWYCSNCLTMLHEYHYNTGRYGLEGFWKAEGIAIGEYNRDVKNRTCPECGTVNPLGYSWNSAKDTADQKRAREIW
jgi:hypothetical protein